LASPWPGVAVAPLQDLDAEAPLERHGTHLQQLAALRIAVVQHIAAGQALQGGVVEREARGEVIVVVLRDVQQRHAGLLEALHLGEQIVAGKGDALQPGATVARQRVGDRRVVVRRNLQRQAYPAAAAVHGAAADQPAGVECHRLVGHLEIEQAAVEQQPAGQPFGRQRAGQLIDATQAAARLRLRVDAKIGVIDAVPRRARLDQIDQAAVRRAYGR